MPTEIFGKTCLTPAEVAEHFGVDRNSVTQRIKRGTLPAVKLGRDYWIAEEDLDKIRFNKNYDHRNSMLTNEQWNAALSEVIPDKLYPARVIAAFFGFTPATVSRHITTGGLPASRVQRGSVFDWQIKGSDAIEFYARKFGKPVPSAPAENN